MTTPTVEEIVEEFQEGLVSSSPKIVSGSIGFYYGHKNGVELYDIDEMLNWLRATLTKVAEEARKEERERIVEYVQKAYCTQEHKDKHYCGFNDGEQVCDCYNEALDDLIAHLHFDK